jgi:GNAT superfamily N-acetyltransferase
MHDHATPRVVFLQCNPQDLESLADLRVTAMRQSLEAVGRFDEHRARARLRDNFEPQLTQLITVGGALAGFFMLKPSSGCLTLEHLYVHPQFQGRGVGSLVLRHIFHTADHERLALHVGALRDSPANRFYARHGFIRVREDEYDIYYRRPPSTQGQPSSNE